MAAEEGFRLACTARTGREGVAVLALATSLRLACRFELNDVPSDSEESCGRFLEEGIRRLELCNAGPGACSTCSSGDSRIP